MLVFLFVVFSWFSRLECAGKLSFLNDFSRSFFSVPWCWATLGREGLGSCCAGLASLCWRHLRPTSCTAFPSRGSAGGVGGQGNGHGHHVTDTCTRKKWASVGMLKPCQEPGLAIYFSQFLYERTGKSLTGGSTLYRLASGPLPTAPSPCPPGLRATQSWDSSPATRQAPLFSPGLWPSPALRVGAIDSPPTLPAEATGLQGHSAETVTGDR